MKVLFKNPVISAIIFNLTILIITTISASKGAQLSILLIPSGLINRIIIDKGVDLNGKKKTIIYLSFFTMLIIYSIYYFGYIR